MRREEVHTLQMTKFGPSSIVKPVDGSDLMPDRDGDCGGGQTEKRSLPSYASVYLMRSRQWSKSDGRKFQPPIGHLEREGDRSEKGGR